MRSSYFRATITLIASFVLLPNLGVSQDVDARQHFEDLAASASFVREGMSPWHLRMTFQLYDLAGKPKENGTIEEWWVSPQIHRLVITSPSYNLTEPSTVRESPSSNRAAFLVRTLLNQAIDPIPHYGTFEKLKIIESKRTFDKVELSCIGVLRAELPKMPVALSPDAQFCVEPGTNQLRIHFDSGQFSAVRNKIAKFRNIELGLDNSIFYRANPAITGHIAVLETYTPDQSSIPLTSSPEPQPVIPGIVLAGKIIKKEQPVYPMAAKQQHIGGSVVLCAIISKEGKIASIDVVASPDPSLSQSALDAVKRWTYSPYLLNGEAVEVATTITVNYNLNQM